MSAAGACALCGTAGSGPGSLHRVLPGSRLLLFCSLGCVRRWALDRPEGDLAPAAVLSNWFVPPRP